MDQHRVPSTPIKKKEDGDTERPQEEQGADQTPVSISVTVTPAPVGAGAGVVR